MRGLVSDNNSFFKKIYSSSVRGYINGYIQKRGLSPQMAEVEKNRIIGEGMSSIYEAVASRFLDIDKYQNYPEGTQQATYFDLKAGGKNWYDKLSVKDLYVLFTFQNKVISQIRQIKNLDRDSFVTTIERTGFIRNFNGHVQFTGRPHSVPEDKNKIDVTDENIRTEVIGELTQYYCGSTQQAINGVALGRHGSEVIRRYFASREQGQGYFEQRQLEKAFGGQGRYINPAMQGVAFRTDKSAHRSQRELSRLAYENAREREEIPQQKYEPEENVVDFVGKDEWAEAQEVMHPEKTMIGLDIQGTPILKVTAPDGTISYEDSLGRSYTGPVFQEDENDNLYISNEIGANEDKLVEFSEDFEQ